MLLILLCPAFVFAQARRGFQPSDLYALRDVSDAQISPDGSRVVYTMTEVSPDHTRNVSHLWIVPTAGGEPRRLTGEEAGESTARWSPEGKQIAFYSSRDGHDGLWVMPADGGAPQLVAHVLRTNFFLTHAGESFTWSPDGGRIAFLSSPESVANASKITPAGGSGSAMAGIPERLRRPLTVEEINQLPKDVREMILRAQGRLQESGAGNTAVPASPSPQPAAVIEIGKPPAADDPRVITRLQYKSRMSFSDNLQSHIFIADLATKQIQQLTDGKYYEHSINWSPKGDEIVFVSNHEPDPDKVNNTDLFVVNVTNGGVRQLTKTKGCEWTPVFSPDGSQIAYLATKREVTTIDSVAEDSHARVIPSGGEGALEIGTDVDRRVSAVRWMNGATLILVAGDKGGSVWFSVKDGKSERFTLPLGDEQLSMPSLSTSKSTAFVASDPTHPSEIFTGISGRHTFMPQLLRREKLSNVNDGLISSLLLSPMRDFSFTNDGAQVQGWLIPPINLDEKKKYPVILLVHGGPHGMHGYSFNPTAQALAARGYAVLLINPRGSSGYGQKFSDGCVNDWGGGDYRDLMKGVDEALAKFPFLDKDRMGVMGGSYGGYMTNWIVTQTDRFKAAVASASLSNLISFYSTSLYQDLIHAEFNSYPWDNFDLLWERSPLRHIKKVKTPLLLIHGEQDNDVHITQAEEMYTALRMRGVETALVRYPREGHGLREPRHREDSLNRTLEWFDRHLK
ncbi:MAG TPA: S9 family peptidase [Blastocatellia bacterium]|nr:S9 family peptidase [Blastocatellia bacterium]